MRKIVAAFNMTLDGYCDHTAVDADEAIHQHYIEVLQSGDLILYGRTTYQLMEFWRDIVINPTGNPGYDTFAKVMDQLPKMVFSRTMKSTDWHSATIAEMDVETTIKQLKQKEGGDILVGSRSLIIQLMNMELLDELQLCIHPIVAQGGLKMFEGLTVKPMMKVAKTKLFESGAVIHYYKF